MILGDNGNIYRIVGTSGFNYDNGYGEQIVVRAAELLDYTPGGPDYNAAAAAKDIGAADEIHGESGDDQIYGGKGDDVLFGDGQNDQIIGGYGNDWISGGTGDDGVIGDDGRISTSRNSSLDHQRRRCPQVHRRPDSVQRGSRQCRADDPDAARALCQ